MKLALDANVRTYLQRVVYFKYLSAKDSLYYLAMSAQIYTAFNPLVVHLTTYTIKMIKCSSLCNYCIFVIY